jgi:hypothetical protein
VACQSFPKSSYRADFSLRLEFKKPLKGRLPVAWGALG